MKKLLPLLILVLLFASCKSKSNIVTSKEVAVEKGIYEYNKEKSKRDNLCFIPRV